MNELVPERRRDRNGRMVLRWVRPASTLPVGRKPVPRPAAPSEIGPEHRPMTTRRQLGLYESLRIEESWMPGSASYLRESEEMRGVIATASAAVIEAGFGVLAACPGDRAVREEVKRTLRLLVTGSATSEYAASRLPFVAVEARSTRPQHVPSIAAMRGSIELVMGDQMEPEDLSPEQHGRALSLAHVLAAVGNGLPEDRRTWLDGHGWRILAGRHRRLVRLALENPDRGGDLADFVAERGPDPEAAEQLLGQDAAFAAGIL